MKIDIRAVTHKQQRYDTAGDWWWEGGVLHIRVSALADRRHMELVALHEMVEALLCREHGVSAEAVDHFDIAFEESRREDDDSEPGDDISAPYYREHQFATMLERAMAGELGVDWEKYNQAIAELPTHPTRRAP